MMSRNIQKEENTTQQHTPQNETPAIPPIDTGETVKKQTMGFQDQIVESPKTRPKIFVVLVE